MVPRALVKAPLLASNAPGPSLLKSLDRRSKRKTTDDEAVPAAAASSASVRALDKKLKGAAPQEGEAIFYSEAYRREPLTDPAFRIISWNVNSLRSLLKKAPSCIRDVVAAERADVVCLQETKLQDKGTKDMEKQLGLTDWHCFWNCSKAKLGYSGTALFSRSKPLHVTKGIGAEEHDAEGRVITAEFPEFSIVTAYVPNAGEGLKRIEYRTQAWDAAFASYLAALGRKKPVVLCGDLNCAHEEMDIHNPKSNRRSAGFTDEERQSFTQHLIGGGLVDVWRKQHSDIKGYTYWHYYTKARERNAGWRIDYFMVTETLTARVHDAFHLPKIMGSDHCPIGLVLKA